MDTENLYYDRDLSWLSFNYRVLLEAKDITVPLYERVNFLAIFSSNLDEFFRVRVAALRGAIKLGEERYSRDHRLSSKMLLAKILETVKAQQEEFGSIYRDHILPALAENGIILYNNAEILDVHQAATRHYFRTKVLTYLQPIIFSEKSKTPFLENRSLYFVIKLKRKQEPELAFQYALLNIPSNHLPRFYALPKHNNFYYYIFLDDVIRCNLEMIFPGYEIMECHSIKLNRDSDLHIDDEYTGDLVDKIKERLDSRNLGVPSRFLYDARMPQDTLDFITKELQLDQADMVLGGAYHNLDNLSKLPNPMEPLLENEPLPALPHKQLEEHDTLFEAIKDQDYILHFPYNSYDYVLRFFNEAAIDPFVSEIKLTVYRIAASSFIANALISAVRNGKKVTVFVEVKARFDEANNLRWAAAMEKAGIKIIYSIPGLKVHAKVALVIRKESGKRQEFAFFGTGNFNESTAKIYADHGLLTANPELTDELNQVFKYLNKRKTEPNLKHLLVSQFNILPRFMELIDREIKLAKAGKTGHIIIKLNNLEDPVMIDKLYEANRAGVQIDLIVRGICCLIPGVEGMSENIKIVRIVDRFLEHARVFIFHHEGKPDIFMGSADWMRRNLYHRVEVVFPIYDEQARQEILRIVQLQLLDNTKGCLLDEEHRNHPISQENAEKIQAQVDTYQFVKEKQA